MPKIIDVSIPLRTGGTVYPGNPDIRIEPWQEIRRGDSSNVSALAFGSHSGTHVDAPLHIFDGAAPVDTLALDVLMGPARVAALDDSVAIVGRDQLAALPLGGVERLLLRTRNSDWLASGGPFRSDYTYVSPDGAAFLVEHGVRLVGVDYLSVEQFHSGHHLAHRTLLGAGVVIVEGLSLAGVPPGDYDLRCLPLRVAGCDGAPARAVLVAG